MVATIYAVATLIFLGYRLDRSAYAKIQAGLDKRRKAFADEAAIGEPLLAPSA